MNLKNTFLHVPYLRTGIRYIYADTLLTPFSKGKQYDYSQQYRVSCTATGYCSIKQNLEPFWSWIDQHKLV